MQSTVGKGGKKEYIIMQSTVGEGGYGLISSVLQSLLLVCVM